LEDCTGALVAGGQGTRLGGIAKGLITVDGEPIAARSVALFRAIFADVVIVANQPEPYAPLGVRIEGDRFPGKGAPGGLHAALASARTPWVFTAACDMPCLEAAPIRHLAAQRGGGALAIVPVWRGVAQPLHALWAREALPLVERMVAAGDPSLQSIVRAVGARLVDAEEWERIDPGGRALENANTPDDLVRLGLTPPPPAR
jgi:molybdopterin-guanine dinucleotide biosynthesis protein A